MPSSAAGLAALDFFAAAILGFLIPPDLASVVSLAAFVFFSLGAFSLGAAAFFDLGLSVAVDLGFSADTDLGLSVAEDLGFSDAVDLGAVAIDEMFERRMGRGVGDKVVDRVRAQSRGTRGREN